MDLSPTCKTCLESFHWNTSMNELPWKNDQNMPSTWQLPCNNDTKLKKYLASKLLFVEGKENAGCRDKCTQGRDFDHLAGPGQEYPVIDGTPVRTWFDDNFETIKQQACPEPGANDPWWRLS